jgi:chaperone required for assembly of F1-ATPase
MNLGIKYTGYTSVLEGFNDENWISDLDQMKSTSGYVFTLAGGVMSWKSSKQTVTTCSTKEAELVALDLAALDSEWLRDLLLDLLMFKKSIPVVLVYYENTLVLLKVNSRKDNQKSLRHIRR